MVGRLKDVRAFRGVAAGMSDYFLVEAKVVAAKEWGNRVVGCRRVVKVEELKKTEKKQEYQDMLKETYDGVKEREVGVSEGCKVFCALKGVMKNRGLGMNVKKALYEKVVVPTVMYGSESWGMKVTERQKLNVFEIKCLRSMTGVSWLDRVRNEVVRARTGVRRELAARVDMNVLRWFGLVERMDNERLLKKVMNAKVDGRSARGRPRFG